MRRTDREIRDRAEIEAVIRGSVVCRVATARDNLPYLVPLCFGYDGSALYLHTAVEGKKVDCFKANPQVCFEFERNVAVRPDPHAACKWSLDYESVIGFGTISEVLEPRAKHEALNQIMRQYSGKSWPMDEASVAGVRVWKIAIESLSGKRSRAVTF